MSDDVIRIGPLSEWPAQPAPEVIDESVPQLLARRLPEIGDRPALLWPADGGLAQLTWSELAARATTVARAFAARAAKGERVAVWSRNTVDYVIVEYAAVIAGLVFAPFNTGWTDAEVEHAIDLVTPTFIFTGTGYTGDPLSSRVRPMAGAIPVIDLTEVDAWVVDGPSADVPEVDADDLFMVQFTSGTTGRSKGAALSHRAALNGALERNRHDANPPNDVWLNPVPYFHIGGAAFVIMGALIAGNAFVVLERWDPAIVLELLRTRTVTRLGGVPTMLVDIVTRLGDSARDAGLVSVSLGGATVTQHLVDGIQANLGIPTLISYGQSECPLISSTKITDDQSVIGGTIGKPLPRAHVRLVDVETGETVPLGAAGELQVKSPFVMQGYWENPEQTASTFTEDGFLRTGDLASMDEFGFMTFLGRTRDVIIRGGENIYPAEVEDLLIDYPGVAGVVLVGLDDERLGEQVAGVVVRTPGSEVTGDELAAYLADKVARFKVPVAWRFVDTFPMTASGKVRRNVLRDETNAQISAP